MNCGRENGARAALGYSSRGTIEYREIHTLSPLVSPIQTILEEGRYFDCRLIRIVWAGGGIHRCPTTVVSAMAPVMEHMLAPDGGIVKVTDRGYGYTGMFILR